MRPNIFLFICASVYLLNLTSCKENLPNTPTIITGKIIDQNGNSIKGARLQMIGIQKITLTALPTFNIYANSDSVGVYMLSQLLPKNTDYVIVQTESTDSVRIGSGFYSSYFEVNGKYVQEANAYQIPNSNLGKTTVLNYKFVKTESHNLLLCLLPILNS